MKKLTLLLMIFIVITSFLPQKKEENKINTLSKIEINEGWELLFDGKSLDNWKIFNGGEVSGWKIIDGILENSGVGSDHGGDIITKKHYKDFELYLEWNVAPESNSGIFFHVQEGETEAIYQSGPEYQLIDDTGWPKKLEAHQYSGANYAMHIPETTKKISANTWNSSKIIVKGTHVEHWLNGEKVVEYELWNDDWYKRKAADKWKKEPYYGIAKTGSIGLQDHGGLSKFRNIKIKVL